MTHSHLSIRHLLRQIERGRSTGPQRDRRPTWLTDLVEFAAELFEPLSDVGRVRFCCALDETGWSVELYLGAIEQVGGKADGQSRHIPFRFELKPLLDRFAEVSNLTWTALPKSSLAPAGEAQSVVVVRGTIEAVPVQLAVFSIAPSGIGPGLRQLPDGRFEPV